MKKLLPLLVVASAVILSGCSLPNPFNRGEDQQASDYGSGIKIEELSQEKKDAFLQTPQKDLETVRLEAPNTTQPASGSGMIRYQYTDQGANFLVTTDLDTTQAPYTVWLRSGDKDNLTLAFKLAEGKGGAWGSAFVPADQLPVEVIVSSSDSKANVTDQTMLQATIPARPSN
jgi:hypothetical protein